jgi:diadenosine tetraphosphatase ApaH/serine/threonine PP2A family protein phosphatase
LLISAGMRIAVLSDIHANLPALDAVLADAGQVDGIWHLGDVVGYGPDPDGVVGRLRDVGAVGVRGNHDAAAVGGSEIDWFNPDARRAMEWTRTAISSESVAWLQSQPVRRTLETCELVHGSPREPLWEYITSPAVARDNLDLLHQPIGLHGHTHVPVAFVDDGGKVDLVAPRSGASLRLDGRRALVNPGSVGQPRDGDPRAAWLLLDADTGHAQWRRVEYDVAGAGAAIRAARLPDSLAERLQYGQ